jgi:hypothetical protein
MADFADYRPYLPGPEQSRIAGEDAISHAKGRLALPRAANLFKQWGELAAQPYQGVTVDGHRIKGLYGLRNEDAPVQQMTEAAGRLLDALSPEERARGLQPVKSEKWREWQNTLKSTDCGWSS